MKSWTALLILMEASVTLWFHGFTICKTSKDNAESKTQACPGTNCKERNRTRYCSLLLVAMLLRVKTLRKILVWLTGIAVSQTIPVAPNRMLAILRHNN